MKKSPSSTMIKWTENLKQDLFNRISTGSSIKEIAGKNGFPHEATIYRKMATDEEFASFIARAREMQQEHEIDYCVELADSATPEDAHVKKLQIWARQWRAAKLAPKKFGDRISNEISGPEGKPLQVQAATVTLSPEQDAAIKEMVARARERVKMPEKQERKPIQ